MFRSVGKATLVASCLGLLLAGCSFSVGTDPSIDKSTVEQGITQMLTKQVGRKPDSVTCPGPLKAKQGESERCTLVGDGAKYGVTVTIASYNNGNANYDIKVDDHPMN